MAMYDPRRQVGQSPKAQAGGQAPPTAPAGQSTKGSGSVSGPAGSAPSMGIQGSKSKGRGRSRGGTSPRQSVGGSPATQASAGVRSRTVAPSSNQLSNMTAAQRGALTGSAPKQASASVAQGAQDSKVSRLGGAEVSRGEREISSRMIDWMESQGNTTTSPSVRYSTQGSQVAQIPQKIAGVAMQAGGTGVIGDYAGDHDPETGQGIGGGGEEGSVGGFTPGSSREPRDVLDSERSIDPGFEEYEGTITPGTVTPGREDTTVGIKKDWGGETTGPVDASTRTDIQTNDRGFMTHEVDYKYDGHAKTKGEAGVTGDPTKGDMFTIHRDEWEN